MTIRSYNYANGVASNLETFWFHVCDREIRAVLKAIMASIGIWVILISFLTLQSLSLPPSCYGGNPDNLSNVLSASSLLMAIVGILLALVPLAGGLIGFFQIQKYIDKKVTEQFKVKSEELTNSLLIERELRNVTNDGHVGYVLSLVGTEEKKQLKSLAIHYSQKALNNLPKKINNVLIKDIPKIDLARLIVLNNVADFTARYSSDPNEWKKAITYAKEILERFKSYSGTEEEKEFTYLLRTAGFVYGKLYMYVENPLPILQEIRKLLSLSLDSTLPREQLPFYSRETLQTVEDAIIILSSNVS